MPEVLDYRTSGSHPLNLPNITAPTSEPEVTSGQSSEASSQEHDARPQSAGQKESSYSESESGAEANQANGETGHKGLSRYEKTKRKIAQLKERESQLAAREQQLVQIEQQRAERERKASEPAYTVGDLQKYRKQWADEGNYDLVEKADAEIGRLQGLEESQKQLVEVPKFGSEKFTQAWNQAERELFEYDPEFMRTGTRVDTELRTLMSGPDGAMYKQHPRGIVAAYHLVKLTLAERDLESERQKAAAYEKEIQRLNGLLGIGGGAPARGGGPFEIRDFGRLSTADMKRHLLSNLGR